MGRVRSNLRYAIGNSGKGHYVLNMTAVSHFGDLMVDYTSRESMS